MYYSYRDHQFVDMITKIDPEDNENMSDAKLKIDFNKLNKMILAKKREEENKNETE